MTKYFCNDYKSLISHTDNEVIPHRHRKSFVRVHVIRQIGWMSMTLQTNIYNWLQYNNRPVVSLLLHEEAYNMVSYRYVTH